MKRIISLLVLISLFLSAFAFAGAEETVFPSYGDKTSLGRVSWSANVGACAVVYDREGNPIVCYATQGGFFFAVDLVSGKVYDRFDAIHDGKGYIFSKTLFGCSDNKAYMWFYPGYTWNIYDPIKRTYVKRDTDLSQIDGFNFYIQEGATLRDEEVVIFGDFNEEPGASLFEYNTQTEEIKRYGPFNKTVKDQIQEESVLSYVKGTAYDDKYLYAGTGTGAPYNVKVIRIDRETGEQKVILDNPGGGIIYNMVMCPGRLVAYSLGKFTVVDTKTLDVVGTLGGGVPSFPSPYDENLIYHFSGSKLIETNIGKMTQKTVAKASSGVFGQWAQLPNRDWVLPIVSSPMKTMGYYNPRTGEVVVNNINDSANAGPNVQGFDISPEGYLLGGGYQTSMGIYNIYTKEFIISEPAWHQNEGNGFLNGKTYFGTYTDAVIFRWDPEKPWKLVGYNYDAKYRGINANPSMVLDIENGQDRPYVLNSFGGNRMYIGTTSGYNVVGGALTILEEEDGSANAPYNEVYQNVVYGQSVTGIAKKGDKIYVGTVGRNGLGTPVQDDIKGHIVVFDEKEKKVVADITPEIPDESDGNSTIGDLSIGPDGLLWGVYSKGGYVFALDPETGETVKSVSVNPGWDRGAVIRPFYLRWGDDGFLYTTAGWEVNVINPETMEAKQIDVNCSLMTLDPDGNVWCAKGSGAYYHPINQYDRLKGFIKTFTTYPLDRANYTDEEWNELNKQLEVAKTYTEETDWETIKNQIKLIKSIRDHNPGLTGKANHIEVNLNGEKLEYSEYTTGIIRIWDNNTYMPYKKILQSLGYKTRWDVQTYILVAEKEGSKLEFTANQPGFIHNGEKVEAPAPLIFGSGLNIPLRAVAEELGYEVTYNHETKMVDVNEK